MAVLTLAACPSEPGADPDVDGAGSPSPTPVAGGTVVFGVLGEPESLDPYSPLASDLTYWLGRPVFPSLFRRAPGAAPEPDLAASIEVTGRAAVVELEPRRWSDGSAITAHDVVASIRRAAPPSGFARIDTARALGRRRLRLVAEGINWPSALATRAYVLPSGKPAGLRVSGGPMVVTSHVPGLELVYRPNPEWDGTPVSLDRVRVTSVLSVEMMIALLDRGELDAAAMPSAVNLDERLDEHSLGHAVTRAGEFIVLDLDGAAPSRATRVAIAGSIDPPVLQEGLIRDDGRQIELRIPEPPSRGSIRMAVQVSAPAGDELLTLMQRVIQRQLREHRIDAELVTIEPQRFYGDWEDTDPTDIALRRRFSPHGKLVGAFDEVPLFEVDTFIAHDATILGLVPNPSPDGPLWNVERWAVATSGP